MFRHRDHTPPPAVTVGELIDALRRYPADLPIVMHGYEGGYGEGPKPRLIRIARDVYDTKVEWWNGPHEEDCDGEIALLLDA